MVEISDNYFYEEEYNKIVDEQKSGILIQTFISLFIVIMGVTIKSNLSYVIDDILGDKLIISGTCLIFFGCYTAFYDKSYSLRFSHLIMTVIILSVSLIVLVKTIPQGNILTQSFIEFSNNSSLSVSPNVIHLENELLSKIIHNSNKWITIQKQLECCGWDMIHKELVAGSLCSDEIPNCRILLIEYERNNIFRIIVFTAVYLFISNVFFFIYFGCPKHIERLFQ